MMPFNGSLRCSMIGLKRRRRISLKMAARHCVSLTKVSHEASSQKFISVKSSLSLLKERLLPVSPKVGAEHCDQHLILRFTKQLKLKKRVEEVGEGEQRGCSLVLLLSLLFIVTPTLIISTMICKVFAPVGVCQFYACLSYMDSPLSRSPGSSVLIGVGLPMTRPSSPLGGPHRLEYCCTPPHSNSPPVFAPPVPRPLLLLLLPPPLLLLFQWGEGPMGWEAPDPAPPILV